MRKKDSRSALEKAIDGLAAIPKLDERERIVLLVETQDRLNNGDAMAFFGEWLGAVCDALEIDIPEQDPDANPFA